MLKNRLLASQIESGRQSDTNILLDHELPVIRRMVRTITDRGVAPPRQSLVSVSYI